MVVVRLRGGLGNQLFQYAMARRMAIKLNTSLKLDLSSLLKKSNKSNVTNRDYQLHIFELEHDFLLHPKILLKLYKYRLNFLVQAIKFLKTLGYKKVKEKTFKADVGLIAQPRNNTIYSGYWQSEKYFADEEAQLRKDLSFRAKLSKEASDLMHKITNSNGVCVHVRRGDYVGNGYFQLMTNDYFLEASQYLSSKIDNLHYYIFSDDPEWCLNNINLNNDFTIIDYNTPNLKYKEDLQLMGSCNHFILSASSFSWWACWLSTYKEKMVVAPHQWFPDETVDTSDLLDPSWKRL